MKSRCTFLALVAVLGLSLVWFVLHPPWGITVSSDKAVEQGVPRPMPPGLVAPAYTPVDTSSFARAGAKPSQTPPAPIPGAIPSATVAITVDPATGNPAAPNSSDDVPTSDPRIEAGQVRRMIVDYHTLMGENPVGTNAEIMQSLMGQNSRQATVSPFDAKKLNAKGELVDRWNIPYFFHQLSKDSMEIHSAGPDKIMGTADDIVVK